MKRTHIYYFDYMRIMAMTFVVFAHTAGVLMTAEVGTLWKLLNIFLSIAYTAVPTFLMISGYLLLSREEESDLYVSKLLRHRIPRLLIPFVAWTIVAILWQIFLDKSFTIDAVIQKIVDSLEQPAMAHLWYMYTLIPIYIISPIFCGIRFMSQKCKRYVLTVMILIILYPAVNAVLTLFSKENVNVDLFSRMLTWGAGGLLLTFILGYFLGTAKVRIPNTVLIVSIIGIWVIISISTYVLSIRNDAYIQTFQDQSRGFEVILAALIFLLFKQNFNKKSRFDNFIRGVSALSMPIYFMHNILISMMTYKGLLPVSFLGVCICTMVNLVICYLSVKTAATIKPICYLATGITFSEACHSCNWIYFFNNVKDAYELKTKER